MPALEHFEDRRRLLSCLGGFAFDGLALGVLRVIFRGRDGTGVLAARLDLRFSSVEHFIDKRSLSRSSMPPGIRLLRSRSRRVRLPIMSCAW